MLGFSLSLYKFFYMLATYSCGKAQGETMNMKEISDFGMM